jgi:uncharacterized PurR-regulated membrane protein YhhQ (DUF165 family)
MRIIGYVSVVLFIATVWAANWAISKWGAVPVGFGFEAPAGVYLAGLAFTLRDVVHRTLGRGVVIGAILVGCALAYLVEGNAERHQRSPSSSLSSLTSWSTSRSGSRAGYPP